MANLEHLEPVPGEPVPSEGIKLAQTRHGRPRGASPYKPIFDRALELEDGMSLPVALMAGDQEAPADKALSLIRRALQRAISRDELGMAEGLTSQYRVLVARLGDDGKVYLRRKQKEHRKQKEQG